MIPFTPNMKVLEVGGGAAPMFHPNLDVRKLLEVDAVADLSEKWPIPDDSYEGVFSKFVIEHVSWRKVGHFVGELLRVLKPGGIAYVISPNTEAQMKWALSQGDAYDKISQCLFGDLDYDENSHKAAFNPAYAIKLFRDAGFDSVSVSPFGELKTDMIIEAKKGIPMVDPVIVGGALIGAELAKPQVQVGQSPGDASSWTPAQRREAYNRWYFDGGRGKVGGYSREGYWDYPVHWVTFDKIMAMKPASVLELGCARGYIVKRLQDAGVRAEGIEVSEHCYLTRVTNGIKTWDLTQTPWPFKDGEFDLCVSVAVLEHIPEGAMTAVAAEIRRVSKRGLHGVDFGDHDDGFDKTHCLFRDAAWWDAKLNLAKVEGFTQIAIEKDELEKGQINPPLGQGIKLNCGSYRTMFHGWHNIDVADLDQFAKQFGYTYRRHDLTAGIPAANGVVDLIYACHFLEHLNYDQGAAFLKDAKRVLKPGGLVRISVPDSKLLAKKYLDGTLSDLDEISSDDCAASPHGARKFWQLLFSGHQAAYDSLILSGMMKDAGFKNVTEMPFRGSGSSAMAKETYDMFPEFSLFVEGTV